MRDNEQTREDRATQLLLLEGWVSQWEMTRGKTISGDLSLLDGQGWLVLQMGLNDMSVSHMACEGHETTGGAWLAQSCRWSVVVCGGPGGPGCLWWWTTFSPLTKDGICPAVVCCPVLNMTKKNAKGGQVRTLQPPYKYICIHISISVYIWT